jgi:choline dehydrogenase-like flavoprotein
MSYDVVIAGAGPAGITLALELARAGLRIALIESGGQDFDPDTQELYDGEVTGNDSVDLMAIRLRLLGGTTNHWGGHCIPLDPIDFDRRPLNGMSGWPFGRDTLLPYYARAHEWLRIGPFDYARDIGAGVSDADFLLPEEPRIESIPLRLARGPLRFGEVYGPALAAEPNIDLQLWSNVTGLILDGDDRIAGVEVAGLDGSRRRVEGRVTVLACGAVETARQLLLANAALGRSFGDAGGLLGGCYMDHPTAGAGFLHFAEPVSARAYWSTSIETAEGTLLRYLWRLPDAVLEQEGLVNAQFFLIPLNDDPEERRLASEARRAERGLRSIAKWAVGRPDGGFRLSQSYCDFITNADSFAVAQWTDLVHGGPLTRRVLLKFESEELPEPSNRVTLTDRRDALGLPLPALHWAPGATERDSMIRTATLIGQLAGQHGLGRMELEDHFDEPFWGTTTSWHQIGTARMAANPREGVTDPDCRVHGTRNLFVASGAVMPTNGRANPTLTILALTIRLADHLKTEIAAL